MRTVSPAEYSFCIAELSVSFSKLNLPALQSNRLIYPPRWLVFIYSHWRFHPMTGRKPLLNVAESGEDDVWNHPTKSVETRLTWNSDESNTVDSPLTFLSKWLHVTFEELFNFFIISTFKEQLEIPAACRWITPRWTKTSGFFNQSSSWKLILLCNTSGTDNNWWKKTFRTQALFLCSWASLPFLNLQLPVIVHSPLESVSFCNL